MSEPLRQLTPPDYLPATVDPTRHHIALVGCGLISEAHLSAYADAGLQVVALCDRTLAKAVARRDAFYPSATATTQFQDVLDDPAIDIVDVATHVETRAELIQRALSAGKHVLSQKPFVSDLVEGQGLIDIAKKHNRLLAINHNGRWAPHFAAALSSVARGDIGDITSADFRVYWPHDQIVENDPKFSVMEDLILADFGIHWFDVVAQLLSGSGAPRRVFASTAHRQGQRIAANTDADVFIEYERALATIVFRASAPRAESGSFRIEGTTGVITHEGRSLGGEVVRIETEDAALDLNLQGNWWSNGMIGTMTELISAIDEGRTPSNSAESSLPGLALCFAALESVREEAPAKPFQVRYRSGTVLSG